MKGIVITTDNKMFVKDFPGEKPLHEEVGEIVGGWIEHVHPMHLQEPFCMIVNEEGRLLDLPRNLVGCGLYGTQEHGQPIVGDIVLLKDGYRDGERDIVGLDDKEIALLTSKIAVATNGKVGP